MHQCQSCASYEKFPENLQILIEELPMQQVVKIQSSFSFPQFWYPSLIICLFPRASTCVTAKETSSRPTHQVVLPKMEVSTKLIS